mmetsp:Transcript_8160/g.28026  ORF Transcript_8160/g.28026 Transcript_8160/m.28026 type:complete len:275 (+) Transcript_8160:2052-2876(+)
MAALDLASSSWARASSCAAEDSSTAAFALLSALCHACSLLIRASLSSLQDALSASTASLGTRPSASRSRSRARSLSCSFSRVLSTILLLRSAASFLEAWSISAATSADAGWPPWLPPETSRVRTLSSLACSSCWAAKSKSFSASICLTWAAFVLSSTAFSRRSSPALLSATSSSNLSRSLSCSFLCRSRSLLLSSSRSSACLQASPTRCMVSSSDALSCASRSECALSSSSFSFARLSHALALSWILIERVSISRTRSTWACTSALLFNSTSLR